MIAIFLPFNSSDIWSSHVVAKFVERRRDYDGGAGIDAGLGFKSSEDQLIHRCGKSMTELPRADPA
jgi:hypothetical protein